MSSGRIAPRSWRVRTAASPKRSRKPWRSSRVAPARSAWVTRRRVGSRAGSYAARRVAAGGLERGVVLASAAGGGQRGRPHAERLAAGRGGEPAGGGTLVEAARDG